MFASQTAELPCKVLLIYMESREQAGKNQSQSPGGITAGGECRGTTMKLMRAAEEIQKPLRE